MKNKYRKDKVPVKWFNNLQELCLYIVLEDAFEALDNVNMTHTMLKE